jgi:hypothetical protein
MSNENETQNETTHVVVDDGGQDKSKDNKAKGLLAQVAERVKGAGDVIQERYIDTLVQKEITERVGLLDKAMQKRFTCLSELNKVNRPDIEAFDAEGKLVSGNFSKERIKAIREAKEALAKVENAIDKALGGDWQKVKELK